MMAEEEKKEQEKLVVSEKKSYIVYGSGLTITDNDFIDYYKTRFKILMVRFNLVGKFTDKGEYFVSNEVKTDLVRMPKEIEDSNEFFFDASNTFTKKEFYFHVDIVRLPQNKAKASLYFYEFVDEYLEVSKIKTHVADFVDEYNNDFLTNVKRVFNLFDIRVPVSDLAVPNLAVAMQDNIDMASVVEDFYELASQIYLARMLDLLSRSGEYGKGIIEEYNALLTENQEKIGSEKHESILKKGLLDRVVDRHGGLEKLEVNKEEKDKIVKEINGTIKAIDGVRKTQVLESSTTNKKDEKKLENIVGKSAPSKPAVKKDAGKPKAAAKPKSDAKKPATAKKDDKNKKPQAKSGGGVVHTPYKVPVFNETEEPIKETENKKPTIVSKVPPQEEKKEETESNNLFDDVGDNFDIQEKRKEQQVKQNIKGKEFDDAGIMGGIEQILQLDNEINDVEINGKEDKKEEIEFPELNQ